MFRYTCIPVPAGMSLPMMTFSFRPRSESDLAWIAASVSTRVVSWKEAADSHDSVASDALVMPIRTARPEAEVPPHRPPAEDPQHLVRVHGPRDELLPDGDVAAVGDQEPGPHRDRVSDLFGAVVGHDDDLPGLLGLLDLDPALVLTDGGHALGDTSLEELLDARQAVGDVLACHTAGVEGTHGELRTRLADRLGGDDADGLADVHPLAGGQRAPVALAADADLR